MQFRLPTFGILGKILSAFLVIALLPLLFPPNIKK